MNIPRLHIPLHGRDAIRLMRYEMKSIFISDINTLYIKISDIIRVEDHK